MLSYLFLLPYLEGCVLPICFYPMRLLLSTCLLVCTLVAAPQPNDIGIKRNALAAVTVMTNAMQTQNYAVFMRYQHQNVIKALGGQDSSMAFYKKQLAKLSGTHTVIKAGKVLQTVKTSHGYQCVAEQLMEVMMDSTRVSSVVPLVGFSDDGTTWTFVDASRGAPAVRSVIPTLDSKLRIPQKHVEFGVALDMMYRTYTPEYAALRQEKKTSRKRKKKK